MKIKLTAVLLSLAISSFAQTYQNLGAATQNLDVTNINPTVLTGGDMFRELPALPNPSGTYNPSFEVPRGSGIHSIFTAALWIGGKDTNNNVYVSSQTYRQGLPADGGYWPGPIATNHTHALFTKYDKVWKVNKTEINNHRILYAQSFYKMPADIASWPGNGNTANGEAAKLAPFIDVNNDGIYSPAQGDYPDIKGDQALYVILNDKAGVKEPISPSMDAEIHVMYYGFNNPNNSPVYNTLFSEYRIINRGQKNFHDFYAGLWIDFDLGNYNDDFVGCDTTTNRFYVYNGDNFDEDSVVFAPWAGQPAQTNYVKSYGANPPVQSAAFLDQKLSHFVYYNNDMNVVNGSPTLATDHYNYLRGVWRNNSQITYGHDGTNQANPPANYMFSGDPVTLSGWSERNTLYSPGIPSANVPSDRRGVGSIGPFNLNAGQELKFTVAYNYSRGTSNLNSVTQSHTDAIAVQNFFRNQIMGTPEKVTPKNELRLFPNPAQDQLNIQLPTSFRNKPASITISDYTGRKILQQNVKLDNDYQNLDIAKLTKGVYFVSVRSENQVITSRLIKL